MAKQYRKQKRLGSYAAAQWLPQVPILHHTETTSDLFRYACDFDNCKLEQKLYPTSYF
ncbi:hypothetical protein LF1_40330 [Rubripirellula obstinata]|uniref:Uncharacterized protein n=1 Tax=Rubripirellula obstinata TaxID=406547 RepID=A0A5B1CQ32_9BACT|nr:hypothetical protein [Rubripirellula obstinata]KAA1261483.1 hypothetical protein LF1_40330 [Rubripirellula obstinata]